jgi:hypothetical protein
VQGKQDQNECLGTSKALHDVMNIGIQLPAARSDPDLNLHNMDIMRSRQGLQVAHLALSRNTDIPASIDI